MKEGYYWIQHVGVVQVAYYTNDTVDDLGVRVGYRRCLASDQRR